MDLVFPRDSSISESASAVQGPIQKKSAMGSLVLSLVIFLGLPPLSFALFFFGAFYCASLPCKGIGFLWMLPVFIGIMNVGLLIYGALLLVGKTANSNTFRARYWEICLLIAFVVYMVMAIRMYLAN